MRERIQKFSICILAAMMIVVNCLTLASAQSKDLELEFYPTPQQVDYANNEISITKDINIVAENDIDIYTKAKIEEVLNIKDLRVENQKVTYTNDIVSDKVNILLGVYGSGGVADSYFEKNGMHDQDHFAKYDAYILDIKDDTIAILGKDTDAAFYGITTLKQLFNQVEGYNIPALTIEDYADIAHRGFIEGYYGTPWTTEDRISLMKYGGDYKMNQYMFAPKDDAYHNSRWRDPYPEKELQDIKRLAQAGEESKNHFVWTIHPFMVSPIRFDETNYPNDFKAITNKFTQLLEVGVRQFGVLADDAGAASNENQVKLLEDLTAWLIEQQSVYPDININLPYCPEAYYHFNNKPQLQALNTAPDNVQIMNTGEATTYNGIWGRVSDTHAATFRNTLTTEGHPGRKPFFWINWPCIDNTKQRLIMGGNDVFLKPGISPVDIEGIVINPMMHAEANKSALFATADYAWNVWTDKAEADQNWHDSFKYMDHGTAVETDASAALRELSKHMIKQGQDGRVVELQESVDLAPKLEAFKKAYEAGQNIKDQGDALIAELKIIKDAGDVYLTAGNKDVAREMGAHIMSLRDVADAGMQFINAAIVLQEDNDYDMGWQYFSMGQALLESSKGYTFHFTAPGEDFYMEARAGMQHLVPFDEVLSTALETQIAPIVNPNIQITKFITNRLDAPATGTIENILDGNDATAASFRDPNRLYKGDYIGISYTKPIALNSIRIVQGGGKNHADNSKLQYTEDGTTWKDLNDKVYTFGSTSENVVIEETDIELDVKVKGIRLIATADNVKDLWWDIYGIDVNAAKEEGPVRYKGTPSFNTENMSIAPGGGTLSNIADGVDGTHTDFAKGPVYVNPDRDTIAADAWVAITFDEAKTIGKIRFLQTGASNAISKAAIEYSVNGTTDWKVLDTYSDGRVEYAEDFSSLNITAKAIRVRNLETKPIWWNVSGLDVYSQFSNDSVDDTTPIEHKLIRSSAWAVYRGDESNLNDKNDNTFVWYNTKNGDITYAGDYIGYDLGRNAYIGNVHIVVGGNPDAPNDKWMKYRLETSLDGITWTQADSDYTGVAGKDVIDTDLHGVVGRYIRLYNLEQMHSWVNFSEFNVEESKEIGTIKNLYTNIRTSANVTSTADTARLLNASDITLANNEYVGIRLDRIKDLQKIVADYDNSDITLEISKNQFEWKTVQNETDVEAARFIRLINKTDHSITFNAAALEVYSNEYSEPSLYRTTIVKDGNYGYQDTSSNGAAFDKKIETSTLFAGTPQAGQDIIYDLGQQRDIRDFALFVRDAATNYMTDAIIEISDRIDGEYTEIMEIGDGVADTNALSVNALNSGVYATSNKYPNYVTASTKDLQVTGRYLKIRFTADNKQRFVEFNEIEINGGEYVSMVNDPTIVVNPIEQNGYAPNKMIDGNLSSGYKPNTNGGAITSGAIVYTLSDSTNTKKINIIQSAGTLSNAKVSVRGSNDDGASSSWKEIGTLNKSFNQLYNYYFKNIFEVKIEWDGIAPFIQEIILIEDYDFVDGDKTELQALYDEYSIVENNGYTEASWKAFEVAKENAKAVLDKDQATQAEIDAAKDALNKAYHDLKQDTAFAKSILKAVIDKTDMLIAAGKLDHLAPSVSAMIQYRLDEAKTVYSNENATNEECLKAWLNLANALHYLDFEANKTDLQNLIDDCKAMDLNGYIAGVEEFKNALAAAETVLADENALQKSINEAYDNLVKAVEGLVKETIHKADLQNIVNIITDAIGDGSKYNHNQAWEQFVEALENANAVLANTEVSQGDVNNAYIALTNAYTEIRLLPDEDLLKQLTDFMTIVDEADKTLFNDAQIRYMQSVRSRAANAIVELDTMDAENIAALQEDMANVMNMIQNAKPEEPSVPSTPETPVIPEESITDAADIQKPTENKNVTLGTTKTGDATNVAGMFALVVMSAGAIVGFRRRKR